jgi:hypothetical protein
VAHTAEWVYSSNVSACSFSIRLQGLYQGIVKGLVIAGNSGFIVPLMSLFASQSPFPVVKLNVLLEKGLRRQVYTFSFIPAGIWRNLVFFLFSTLKFYNKGTVSQV